MIIGLIAGPTVGAMLVDYINITPNRLLGLLENGDVSMSLTMKGNKSSNKLYSKD
jgi:hypothetical protein